jgi:hypothetical protein
MKRYFLALLLSVVPTFPSTGAFGQQPSFKVLAFYSTKMEPDHVLFAEGALKFVSGLSGLFPPLDQILDPSTTKLAIDRIRDSCYDGL